MKKRSLTIFLALLCLAIPGLVSAQVSTAGVIFLTIEPGARNAGMGGGGVALGADAGATASFYNPAALAVVPGTTLSGMHNKALPELADDLYYEVLGATYSLGESGGLGANLTFYSYGSQTWTDGVGNDLGTIDSFDLAATVGYGLSLSRRTAIGGSFKLIYSNLSEVGAEAERGDGRAFTFALDAGILFTDLLPRTNLGISLQNIGPDIAYIDRDQADPLPQSLRIGVSHLILDSPGHRLLVIYDMYKLLAQTENIFLTSILTAWTDDDLSNELKQLVHMVGAEYVFGGRLALRAGYFYDKAGFVKYPTFGMGLSYGSYQFDLSHAYAPDKPYAQGTRVSFGLVF
jgi:hypothetical protein